MANSTIGALNVKISADTKNFEKGMKRTGKVLKANEKKLKENENAHKSWAKSLNTSSVAVTAAAGVAVAATGALVAKFFLDSTKAATDFNKSMANLSAITGATGKDLQFLRETALEFGATTTLSATQASEALKLVASAKPDLLSNAAALKEVTKQAVLLAEASGGTLTLGDSAGVVGKALNQFSEDADQAARFVNVLAAGAKFGSSEVLATSLALKNAGVAAASAGVSFEETNAAIQVLAKNGIEGAEAGSALRNIFLKLDTDTNSKLRPSVVGLSTALKNLNALNETGAQQVKRFGLENIVAGKSLLSNVSSLTDLTGKLTGTNTAFEQASTNVNNLDGDLLSLNSAYEALQIQVGSLADNELRQITQATTEFIQALNGNEAALKEWEGTFKAIEIVALSVAAILTARLVPAAVLATAAQLSLAAASLKGSVTMNALGVVTGRTTVAMNVGAVAARGMGAALAFIGGPVGVAILAALALYQFVDGSDDTAASAKLSASEVDKLKESFKALSESNKKLKLQEIAEEIKIGELAISKLNAKLKQNKSLLKSSDSRTFKMAQQSAANLSNQIKTLNSDLSTLKQKQEVLDPKSKSNSEDDGKTSDRDTKIAAKKAAAAKATLEQEKAAAARILAVQIKAAVTYTDALKDKFKTATQLENKRYAKELEQTSLAFSGKNANQVEQDKLELNLKKVHQENLAKIKQADIEKDDESNQYIQALKNQFLSAKELEKNRYNQEKADLVKVLAEKGELLSDHNELVEDLETNHKSNMREIEERQPKTAARFAAALEEQDSVYKAELAALRSSFNNKNDLTVEQQEQEAALETAHLEKMRVIKSDSKTADDLLVDSGAEEEKYALELEALRSSFENKKVLTQEQQLALEELEALHLEKMQGIKDSMKPIDTSIGILEALGLQYQTEETMLIESLARKQAILDAALANKSISEDEHEKQTLAIKQQGEEAKRKITLQNVQEGFAILASGSKKAQKLLQGVAVAQAVVSGYGAAVEAWRMGMASGGPWVAAAYTAASVAKTAGMISQMKSSGSSMASSGGGTPSTSGGGSAGGSTMQQAAPQQAQISAPQVSRTIDINLPSTGLLSVDQVRELMEQINEQVGDGVQLNTGNI